MLAITQDSCVKRHTVAPQGYRISAISVTALGDAAIIRITIFADKILYSKLGCKPAEIGPRRFLDLAPIALRAI